jgi:hypothetical protein
MKSAAWRTVGTLCLWSGLALVVVGAIIADPSRDNVVGAGTRSAPKVDSATQDIVSSNPEKALYDDAIEVRRRAREFREREQSARDESDLSRTFYVVGGILVLLGACGRIVGGRARTHLGAS